MKYQDTIKCVIFDCDGTLVDSEILCALGLEMKLKELGYDQANAEVLSVRFRGWKLANILDALSTEYNLVLDDAFATSYRQLVGDLFDSQLQAIPNVTFALKNIPHPKCVASNAPLNKIKQAVRVTNLEHFFHDHLYSAYTVQAWKPEPALFLYAAKMMGIQPQHCIVIEDSILGIEAAQNAGMYSFYYQPDRVEKVPTLDNVQYFTDMLECYQV